MAAVFARSVVFDAVFDISCVENEGQDDADYLELVRVGSVTVKKPGPVLRG